MSDGVRRTVRTVFQNVLGLAAGLPLIVDAAGFTEAVPGVAVSLTVAGIVTRVMALPSRLERRTRRRLLPMVTPKPRSSGSAKNFP